MQTVILTLVFLGIAVIGMAVRVILVKNGELKGTCASKNPMLNKTGEACGLCGSPNPSVSCNNAENKQ